MARSWLIRKDAVFVRRGEFGLSRRGEQNFPSVTGSSSDEFFA